MTHYQGEYEFQCKNSDYDYSGKAQYSFIYDDETDEAIGMDMVLDDVEAFDLMKEKEVHTIRVYMLDDIKNLICADLVNYAIEHDTY